VSIDCVPKRPSGSVAQPSNPHSSDARDLAAGLPRNIELPDSEAILSPSLSRFTRRMHRYHRSFFHGIPHLLRARRATHVSQRSIIRLSERPMLSPHLDHAARSPRAPCGFGPPSRIRLEGYPAARLKGNPQCVAIDSDPSGHRSNPSGHRSNRDSVAPLASPHGPRRRYRAADRAGSLRAYRAESAPTVHEPARR